MACKELLFVLMVAVTLDILAATPRPVEGRFAKLRRRRGFTPMMRPHGGWRPRGSTLPPSHQWRPPPPRVTARRPSGRGPRPSPREFIYPWHHFTTAPPLEGRKGKDQMGLRHASEGAKLKPGALVTSLGLGLFLLTSCM